MPQYNEADCPVYTDIEEVRVNPAGALDRRLRVRAAFKVCPPEEVIRNDSESSRCTESVLLKCGRDLPLFRLFYFRARGGGQLRECNFRNSVCERVFSTTCGRL